MFHFYGKKLVKIKECKRKNLVIIFMEKVLGQSWFYLIRTIYIFKYIFKKLNSTFLTIFHRYTDKTVGLNRLVKIYRNFNTIFQIFRKFLLSFFFVPLLWLKIKVKISINIYRKWDQSFIENSLFIWLYFLQFKFF